MRAAIYAGDHPAVASARAHLGRLQWLAGERSSGEQLLREAIAMHDRLSPPGSQAAAAALLELGSLLREQGKAAGADSLVRASLALRRRLLAADHPAIAASLIELGRIHAAVPNRDSVDSWLGEAQRILDGAGLGVHPLRIDLARARATRLAASGAVSRAVEQFEGAEAMLMALFPHGHPDLLTVIEEHAAALSAAGRVIEASAVRSRVRQGR